MFSFFFLLASRIKSTNCGVLYLLKVCFLCNIEKNVPFELFKECKTLFIMCNVKLFGKNNIRVLIVIKNILFFWFYDFRLSKMWLSVSFKVIFKLSWKNTCFWWWWLLKLSKLNGTLMCSFHSHLWFYVPFIVCEIILLWFFIKFCWLRHLWHQSHVCLVMRSSENLLDWFSTMIGLRQVSGLIHTLLRLTTMPEMSLFGFESKLLIFLIRINSFENTSLHTR